MYDSSEIEVDSVGAMFKTESRAGITINVCLLDVKGKPYEKELIKIAREVRELRNKIDSEK